MLLRNPGESVRRVIAANNHLRSSSRNSMETCSRTSENLPKFPSQSPLLPLVTGVRQRPVVVTEGGNVRRAIFGHGIWKLGIARSACALARYRWAARGEVGRNSEEGEQSVLVSPPPPRAERGSAGGWKCGARGLARLPDTRRLQWAPSWLLHELECSRRAPCHRDPSAFSSLVFALRAHTLVPRELVFAPRRAPPHPVPPTGPPIQLAPAP